MGVGGLVAVRSIRDEPAMGEVLGKLDDVVGSAVEECCGHGDRQRAAGYDRGFYELAGGAFEFGQPGLEVARSGERGPAH